MEKTQYHFMGIESHVGDVALTEFGQEVSFTDAEAINAIDGGAICCPADKWPLTAEESATYAYPEFRRDAPEDIKQKIHAAYQAVAEHLAALKAKAK